MYLTIREIIKRLLSTTIPNLTPEEIKEKVAEIEGEGVLSWVDDNLTIVPHSDLGIGITHMDTEIKVLKYLRMDYGDYNKDSNSRYWIIHTYTDLASLEADLTTTTTTWHIKCNTGILIDGEPVRYKLSDDTGFNRGVEWEKPYYTLSHKFKNDNKRISVDSNNLKKVEKIIIRHHKDLQDVEIYSKADNKYLSFEVQGTVAQSVNYKRKTEPYIRYFNDCGELEEDF